MRFLLMIIKVAIWLTVNTLRLFAWVVVDSCANMDTRVPVPNHFADDEEFEVVTPVDCNGKLLEPHEVHASVIWR